MSTQSIFKISRSDKSAVLKQTQAQSTAAVVQIRKL